MSVSKGFDSFVGFLNSFVENGAVIDNKIFKLHYRVTSIALLVAGIVVLYKEHFGAAASCLNGGLSAEELKPMTAYCAGTDTFTVRKDTTGIPYSSSETDRTYHSYYRTVSLMLFFQAFLFCIPHWLWKNWEKGRMNILTDGLRGADIPPKATREEKQSRIVQYFIDSLHMNGVYAKRYFICEVFNLLNVIANMFLTDNFLGGNFFAYGVDVLKFKFMYDSQLYDPMITTFPTQTNCEVITLGVSGLPQRRGLLCTLPLNTIHAKVYIYLWFWFIILFVFSAFAVLYNAVVFLVPKVREIILKRRFKGGTFIDISSFIQNTQVGDFFLLHLMGRNLNTKIYNDVLEEISNKVLENKHDITSTVTAISLQPISPDTARIT